MERALTQQVRGCLCFPQKGNLYNSPNISDNIFLAQNCTLEVWSVDQMKKRKRKPKQGRMRLLAGKLFCLGKQINTISWAERSYLHYLPILQNGLLLSWSVHKAYILEHIYKQYKNHQFWDDRLKFCVRFALETTYFPFYSADKILGKAWFVLHWKYKKIKMELRAVLVCLLRMAAAFMLISCWFVLRFQVKRNGTFRKAAAFQKLSECDLTAAILYQHWVLSASIGKWKSGTKDAAQE